MGSEGRRGWSFAFRLAARGALAGGLIVAAVHLLLSGRAVSAVMALALAVLASFDLVRIARRAERAMGDFVEQLAIGADDLPARLDPAFRHLDAAIVRAVAGMRERRARLSAEASSLQALLDTVAAALFVTTEAGSIVYLNCAARGLAQGAVENLARHPAFAPHDARELATGRPGLNRIFTLKDGRTALGGVALFDLADGTRRRMISVQIVSEELGAVELNAWHRLSRVLAHEMVNSLSPVISLADSLATLTAEKESELDRSEIAEIAGLIARRASHLMNFVERYREVLEVPEPILAPVPLADLVEDLTATVGAGAADVEIHAAVEPPDLVARIDRELMEQALLNLLKNAVEALDGAGQARIDFSCRENDDAVLIEVADDGPGLPPDRENLFLPFFTTKPEGSGIGLAIARQIALAHQGTLTAEPLAQGAKFTLRLPKQ